MVSGHLHGTVQPPPQVVRPFVQRPLQGPDRGQCDARVSEDGVRLRAFESGARRRCLEKELRHKPKTDRQKARIARRLRQETTMTLAWIAQRLQMGSVNTLKNTLRLT